MDNNQTDTSAKVVCQHKPGDVWADGCCTSRSKETNEAKAGSLSKSQNATQE